MRRRSHPVGKVEKVSPLAFNGVWPIILSVLLFAVPALSQVHSDPSIPEPTSPKLMQGSIIGAVVDQTGASIVGAKVTLSRDEGSPETGILSDEDGQFSFVNVPPGPFHLSISATGFATQTSSATLGPGETSKLPPTTLALMVLTSPVEVTLTKKELVEDEIRDEEQQRILGFLPNFYVSYLPNALPLDTQQKFKLAWRSSMDPVTFGVAGLTAGLQQWRNEYVSFGQGAGGYGKRFGAAYATLFTGTMMSDAVLPSILKQDPRYFYKGTGTIRSRFLYAISRSVISKGDNGKWQPNYSAVLGSFAASGISNLFYPSNDRNGVALTFENTCLDIAENAVGNVFQEFWVKKLTPHARKFHPDPRGPEVP